MDSNEDPGILDSPADLFWATCCKVTSKKGDGVQTSKTLIGVIMILDSAFTLRFFCGRQGRRERKMGVTRQA